MPKATYHTITDYINALPDDRKAAVQQLHDTIVTHLPKGFEATISYGMIGYVVPHSIYPKGYHCDTKLPLPFINIASQKKCIAIYHMGMYADANLLAWFTNEYPKHSKQKLDMGKSCIRFKKIDDIPHALIGALSSKMTVKNWITIYEQHFVK